MNTRTNGIPEYGFKNVMDGFHPEFHTHSQMHATACNFILKGEATPEQMRKLSEIVQTCEAKFPLLREFRETCPDLNDAINDLTELFPN